MTRIARWSGVLPAVGSKVVTSKGRGRVIAQEILAQKLVIELDDQRRIIVGPSDIQNIEAAKRPAARDLELDLDADDPADRFADDDQDD